MSDSGTVIDLFCGCGGFSLGAELAGFRSLVAVDIDPTLQSGYRRNFSGSHVVEGDVADLDLADWRILIGKRRPDGVIGGPPCQGFSWIGKRRQDDPRNSLIHQFYRQVALLKPKFFVMENVEGILGDVGSPILNSALELVAPSYRILGPFVITASDYGAATTRRRVVIVGYDPNDVDPLITDLFTSAGPTPPNVREAISDLPGPVKDTPARPSYGWGKYPAGTKRLSQYARRLRAPAPAGLGWAEAVDRHAQGAVSGVAETRHSPEISRRYAVLPEGKTDPITKSYRLSWSGLCPTLRAGTGSDKGAFQAVRPLHPGKGRVITVREAARLQGFPDWFVFHPTKWHSFRMLGNSVSPFVSEGLLRAIGAKSQLPLAA